MPIIRHLAAALVALSTLSPMAFAADSALAVSQPYVRLVPPNAPTSAAFMVISNDGDAERQLLRAESPAARRVELHTHLNENGVMKMREVAHIGIKAKSQTELKPGAYHLMLIDLKQALKADEMVPITLFFDDGSTLQVSAPVKKIATAPAEMNGNHSPTMH